jgi:segregation and condensation protein B
LKPEVGQADEQLLSHLESVLLVAGGPISVSALAQAVGRSRPEVASALGDLRQRLQGGIRLQLHGHEAQLVTAPENVDVIHRFLGTARPAPLSRASVETLTVIAYKQPVTRAEIEATRGANSDRAVQTLLARELIEELGPRQTLGRPMQYGTTFRFLEYFGLSSLQDLPPLPDEEQVAVQQLGLRAVQTELADYKESADT